MDASKQISIALEIVYTELENATVYLDVLYKIWLCPIACLLYSLHINTLKVEIKNEIGKGGMRLFVI